MNKGRVRSLERRLNVGPCDRTVVTCILVQEPGQPEPQPPADALVCGYCGRPHGLVIVEEVVEVGPPTEPPDAPPAGPAAAPAAPDPVDELRRRLARLETSP